MDISALKTRLPMTGLLASEFFVRPPDVVARDLLGKILVRHLRSELLSGRIIEVEAYMGPGDAASHTAIGKTERNAVLFGPPGIAHVYFVYGMHYCLSVSCLPEGVPGGVLLRALTPLQGTETMARNRGVGMGAGAKMLTGGPGKLCEAFGITREHFNGLDLTSNQSPLQLLDDGVRPQSIEVTPRIGISKAVDRPLRFLLSE